MSSITIHILCQAFLQLWTALLIGPAENDPYLLLSPLRLLIQKLWMQQFGWQYQNIFVCCSPDIISSWYWTLESYLVAIFHFQAFVDSSGGGIVERHMQCLQSPMHLVESAAPSGSSCCTLQWTFKAEINEWHQLLFAKTLTLKLRVPHSDVTVV